MAASRLSIPGPDERVSIPQARGRRLALTRAITRSGAQAVLEEMIEAETASSRRSLGTGSR